MGGENQNLARGKQPLAKAANALRPELFLNLSYLSMRLSSVDAKYYKCCCCLSGGQQGLLAPQMVKGRYNEDDPAGNVV